MRVESINKEIEEERKKERKKERERERKPPFKNCGAEEHNN